LWIVLINSIKRANLTVFCILVVREKLTILSLTSHNFRLKQLLHGCRQFLFYNVWLIPRKNETFIASC